MAAIGRNLFDLGVNLGIASYQASVQQIPLAVQGLTSALPLADALRAAGFNIDTGRLNSLINGPPANLHDAIVSLREDYEGTFRPFAPSISALYVGGLLIGIAEGQASGPFPDQARAIARDSLLRADQKMFHDADLRASGFDPTILFTAIHGFDIGLNRETLYNTIFNMRLEYSNDAANSPLP